MYDEYKNAVAVAFEQLANVYPASRNVRLMGAIHRVESENKKLAQWLKSLTDIEHSMVYWGFPQAIHVALQVAIFHGWHKELWHDSPMYAAGYEICNGVGTDVTITASEVRRVIGGGDFGAGLLCNPLVTTYFLSLPVEAQNLFVERLVWVFANTDGA